MGTRQREDTGQHCRGNQMPKVLSEMDRMLFILFLLILGCSSTVMGQGNTTNWCPQPNIPKVGDICNNMLCDTCNNSRNCTCLPGFNSSGIDVPLSCIDINECREKTHNCSAFTHCNNTAGSYFCECDRGFQSASNTTILCPKENKTDNRCYDIDECRESPSLCGPHSICRNFPSSFTCFCQVGYRDNSTAGSKITQCVDINECRLSPSLCGPHSICLNSPGSFKCSCQDGYRDNSTTESNITQCVVMNKERCATEQPCTKELFQCNLDNIISSITSSCESTVDMKEAMKQFLNKLDSLFKNGKSVPQKERLKQAGKILQGVETAARNRSLLLKKNITLQNNNNRIRLQVLISTKEKSQLSLQSNETKLELDWKTAAEENETGLAAVGFLQYWSLSELLEGAELLGKYASKPPQLISPVVSAFLSRKNTRNLKRPVLLQLQHSTENVDPNRTLCAFWSNDDNAWSDEGCEKLQSTENWTQCNCSHLTSFAILMALEHFESWTLSLITKIGLSISIICLVFSIITFSFCRAIQGTRNTIHTHLCISLLLGHLVFLIGVTATNHTVVCGLVAGCLHTCYLSAFCWMSLEGLELYLMLVRVFDTHCLKTRHLLAVGYGVPILIVVISASVFPRGYGTEKHCWLSLEKNFIWSFMGPVCIILLVNCGIFVLTVWKLTEKMSSINPEQGKYKRIRSLTATAVAQICILGCGWVFGLMQFGSATPFFAYAFSILNTLQGLQIFLLHCVMHRKVRTQYAKWFSALVHLKPPSYSEFSTNSNTQTQSKTKHYSCWESCQVKVITVHTTLQLYTCYFHTV
ncbi:adhesion G protein-coupled receptor E5 [Rhinophrynus dorsalis]